jgi:hypothetical protein
MKKLLLAVAAVAALATPAYASHWECVVQKETHSMNRPGAKYPEYRLPNFEKGDVVSIRDTSTNDTNPAHHPAGRWDFITRSGLSDDPGYGWVPHGVLGNCQAREGT